MVEDIHFEEFIQRLERRRAAKAERRKSFGDVRGWEHGLNAEVPWAFLAVVIEKGTCRWCGKPVGPRATWCGHSGPVCSSAVYNWWFTTKALQRAVFARDGFTCVLCGRSERFVLRGRMVPDLSALHMDHIVPIALGGKTEPANLQTLCAGCNLRKGRKRAIQTAFAPA